MNKALIELFYEKGIYSAKNLDTFVMAGFITAEEAEEIRGE